MWDLDTFDQPSRINMTRGAILLCVVTVLTSAVAQSPPWAPSIARAEERVQELAQILADVKNAVQPRHCADLLRSGQSASGVYTIFHKAAGPSGQRVYCDMETDGGGWTVGDSALSCFLSLALQGLF
ncbi:hypothetical protein HPB51_014633 [Rhipicephalus microplus]|uniref:Fibrinogen C-terminal domain-containing protein n=1 Tax=Rhipicephalus microplus TaxID=6941 RepID=A0A9J6F5F4_RHIMP|nr:hypothetical protein HPB51_014633 [Rhipicephalus microplus]